MTINTVNYDLILHVLQLAFDYAWFDVLANCATVNRQFHQAASSYLYRRVILSPAPQSQVDLRRRNQQLVSVSLSVADCDFPRLKLNGVEWTV